jgi:hypothetical protein
VSERNPDGGTRRRIEREQNRRPPARTPCHLEGLDDLAQRILGSKTATPFDWTFTRRDLNALLDRLDQRGWAHTGRLNELP